MLRSTWAGLAGAAVWCGLVAGCSGGRNNGTAQNTGTDSTATAKGPAATSATAGGDAATTMSDANILALLHEADAGEIAEAQSALKKASHASVKSFARQMLHDHQRLDIAATRAGDTAHITPQAPPNDTLPQHAQHEKAQLDSTKGAAFDRAYIDGEVADHQTVLTLLQQAQGAAQAPQIKTAVTTAITKVQQHLDLAKKLQGQLGQSGTSSQ